MNISQYRGLFVIIFFFFSCTNDSVENLQDSSINEKKEDELIFKLDVSNEIDFGEIQNGDQEIRFFGIQNVGNQEINVLNISSADKNLDIEFSRVLLKPNEELKIKVVFKPNAEGDLSSVLKVETDIVGNNIVEVVCIGVVIPKTISGVITYNIHIKPIIDTNCSIVGCHDAITKAKNYSFVTYEETKSNFEGTSFHDPLQQIELGLMPRGLSKLSTEEINLIKEWIAQGFKE